MKKVFIAGIMAVFVLGIAFFFVFGKKPVKQDTYSYTPDGYGEAKKLLEIPYGESEETLGHSGGNGEKIPPKSFFIAENGDVYILDSLHYAVKHYLSDGTYCKTIPLPEEIKGLDIEKLGDFLFIYEVKDNLYMIEENKPENYCKIEIAAYGMEGLYATEDALYLRTSTGKDKKIQLIEEGIQELHNESSPVTISVEQTNLLLEREGKESRYSAEEREAARLKMTVRLEPMGCFYIGKKKNIEYCLMGETDWSYLEERVARFVEEVNTKSALLISGKEYIYGLPFKTVYIRDDIVYQMVPEKTGLAIYQIPWSTSIQTRFSEEMIEEFQKKEELEETEEEEDIE